MRPGTQSAYVTASRNLRRTRNVARKPSRVASRSAPCHAARRLCSPRYLRWRRSCRALPRTGARLARRPGRDSLDGTIHPRTRTSDAFRDLAVQQCGGRSARAVSHRGGPIPRPDQQLRALLRMVRARRAPKLPGGSLTRLAAPRVPKSGRCRGFPLAPWRQSARAKNLRDFCVISSARLCSVRMFGNGRPRQVVDY